MSHPGELKVLGRERLERVIEKCVAIESHATEPFMLDVDEIIAVVREYFPHWQHPDELKLDAETLHHLATVVKMQSEWVKQRSSALYTDPFLLEAKIQQVSEADILDIFVHAWNPLVECEQLSLFTLAQGLMYWEALAPINMRWKDIQAAEVTNSLASREELIKQRVLGDKEFSTELNCHWQQLKDCAAKAQTEHKLLYWDFIGADTYEETVQRAFLTSFLVTYGYATLDIDRIEETVFIRPFETPKNEVLAGQLTSVPIAVSYEDWQKWKRGELK